MFNKDCLNSCVQGYLYNRSRGSHVESTSFVTRHKVEQTTWLASLIVPQGSVTIPVKMGTFKVSESILVMKKMFCSHGAFRQVVSTFVFPAIFFYHMG